MRKFNVDNGTSVVTFMQDAKVKRGIIKRFVTVVKYDDVTYRVIKMHVLPASPWMPDIMPASMQVYTTDIDYWYCEHCGVSNRKQALAFAEKHGYEYNLQKWESVNLSELDNDMIHLWHMTDDEFALLKHQVGVE